jgi:hypothetical protein
MPSGPRPSAPPELDGSAYDAYYFRHCCGRPYGYDEHWTRFFGTIADTIVRDIAPVRVLDAGCAMGILVDALRSRGADAHGIDLSPFALDHCADAIKPYCRLGSITEPFGQRYDLICCIEVVEHLPPDQAEHAIANLCRATDDVLFSSSPEDYQEPTHLCVRPPEHWAELFARHGFYRDPEFSASVVSPWAVRFRRSLDPWPRIVRGFEKQAAGLTRENADLRRALLVAQGRLAQAEERLETQSTALHDDIAQLRRQVATLEPMAANAAQAIAEASAARDTVAHMQRSVFWKLRRLLGRR